MSGQKKENKKIGRITGMLTVILPIFSVAALSLLLVCLPKKDFSENENRTLQAFPELSWQHIRDGSYTADLENYLTDHFPFRDFWIGLMSETERLMGKAEIDGVLLAEDDYLIEEYKKPQNTERIAKIFSKFAVKLNETDCNAWFMLVPTAVTIYEDRLPKGAVEYRQTDTIDEIRSQVDLPYIDVQETLTKHRDDAQIFYRTDHHWTTTGAYYAYLEYCQAAGFAPQELEDMQAQTVTDHFRGTYYSKVNLWRAAEDEIVIYTNPKDALTVDYRDKNVQTDTLYNLDYVEEKDKYSLFLDNLHTLVEITNETAESERELLLVKDSYANSMVPFLVRHYHKIYVVDTRYYKEGPSSLLKEHSEITDVLILYNLSTLDNDTGIRGIF